MIRRIALATVLVLGVFSMPDNINGHSDSAPAFARCTGAKNCRACKNCNYCKHCAKNGGTCGVCKPKR